MSDRQQARESREHELADADQATADPEKSGAETATRPTARPADPTAGSESRG